MTGTLLFIIGPPAVGKMTVGEEISARTGLRLFHNHLAIEPVLRFFPFGSPPFGRLVDRFRYDLIEEVAASDLPGLIFTYVWAFDLPEDGQAVQQFAHPFRRRSGRVLFLELEASQEERLRRNEGTSRLAEKPSKRDVSASRRNLLDLDRQYQLNSSGQFDDSVDYLRINNTDLTPDQVAMAAINHFRLHRQPEQDVPSASKSGRSA
ncbi:AAA family ATPase [Micromonospora sp. NPDC052213]|uniref:AAA family ATPase n=1 Tax=Micromonospora sp. NPDC052213 TaxID=3155812 RepID=UPI0034134E22